MRYRLTNSAPACHPAKTSPLWQSAHRRYRRIGQLSLNLDHRDQCRTPRVLRVSRPVRQTHHPLRRHQECTNKLGQIPPHLSGSFLPTSNWSSELMIYATATRRFFISTSLASLSFGIFSLILSGLLLLALQSGVSYLRRYSHFDQSPS